MLLARRMEKRFSKRPSSQSGPDEGTDDEAAQVEDCLLAPAAVFLRVRAVDFLRLITSFDK